MRSLQVRLIAWIALVTLAVLSGALLAFNLYAMHRVTQHSKKYLRGIASSIAREVAAAGPVGKRLPRETAAAIEDHLAFVDPRRQLAAAVLAADGRKLYRTAQFTVPIDEDTLRGDRSQLRLVDVGSGTEPSDAYSEWRFVLRHEEAGFIVLVSDAYHFELAERLTEGVLMAVLVAVLLAVPSGYLVSRRILRPFMAIDQAAGRVRQGELQARIPAVARNPEVAQLISSLNATFAELEASFHRIRQFSADAAHELNTPLTALRGNLEVCLARERNVEEYQAVLAESVQEISRLSGMVRDLLLLASPGSADRRAAFTTIEFQSLVAETTERLSIIAAESGVRIVTEVAAAGSVPGDAMLLRRALYNLVHNAIRYSPRDTEVTISARQWRGVLVVEVKDQGAGIPKEQQDRIFERFYRLDPSRAAGTGLGLSMAKWIVELHQGRIEVESEPGKGSVFRLILPQSRA
jgi:heavy metal sensor kinase